MQTFILVVIKINIVGICSYNELYFLNAIKKIFDNNLGLRNIAYF